MKDQLTKQTEFVKSPGLEQALAREQALAELVHPKTSETKQRELLAIYLGQDPKKARSNTKYLLENAAVMQSIYDSMASLFRFTLMFVHAAEDDFDTYEHDVENYDQLSPEEQAVFNDPSYQAQAKTAGEILEYFMWVADEGDIQLKHAPLFFPELLHDEFTNVFWHDNMVQRVDAEASAYGLYRSSLVQLEIARTKAKRALTNDEVKQELEQKFGKEGLHKLLSYLASEDLVKSYDELYTYLNSQKPWGAKALKRSNILQTFLSLPLNVRVVLLHAEWRALFRECIIDLYEVGGTLELTEDQHFIITRTNLPKVNPPPHYGFMFNADKETPVSLAIYAKQLEAAKNK